MQWDTEELGSRAYFNQTKASRVAVNVQAHHVHESLVRQLLKL
jgi:hypothetical protein